MKAGGAGADELKARSTEIGTRIEAGDERLRELEAQLEDLLLRIPQPPDPDVPVGGEEDSVIVRTWGEPVSPEGKQAALGGGRQARHVRPRGGREGGGKWLPDLRRCREPSPARADQLLPRSAHVRARLHGGLAAGRHQRGFRAWHGPDPGQGRPDVRRHARRSVPRPDRGSARHQHPPRRDHRGVLGCRSATSPTRPVSAARPAPPAPRRAASCGSTSSTRSRWSASRSRQSRTRRSSG